jgi:hypothetical protein
LIPQRKRRRPFSREAALEVLAELLVDLAEAEQET